MSVARKRRLNWHQLATERVGVTPLKRLQWLLKFSAATEKDFSALSKSKLAEREWELIVFAEERHQGFLIPRFSAKELGVLAEAFGKALSFLREAGPYDVGGPGSRSDGSSALGWHFDPSLFHRLDRVIEARTFRTHYEGDLSGVFLMAAIDLLEAEGRRITKCSWAPCGKLFIKRKRGLFCSPSCSRKGRTHRYIESHREQISESRHEAYVKSVEKLKGKAVARRVQRRAPRAKQVAAVRRLPGTESRPSAR